MIQFQVRIHAGKELDMEVDVLRREDANELEGRAAKFLEDTERAWAKSVSTSAKVTEIPDPYVGPKRATTTEDGGGNHPTEHAVSNQ